MLCCGSERKSRFCPECGKALPQPHPLADLLVHLQAQAKGQQSTAETVRSYVKFQSQDQEHTARRIARHERAHDKYQRWADTLAEMIAADEQRASINAAALGRGKEDLGENA